MSRLICDIQHLTAPVDPGPFLLESNMTRSKFRAHAPALALSIRGAHLADMPPKQHKTGGLGWQRHDRMGVRIGDEHVAVQVMVTLTLIGSKHMPEDDAPSPDAQAEG